MTIVSRNTGEAKRAQRRYECGLGLVRPGVETSGIYPRAAFRRDLLQRALSLARCLLVVMAAILLLAVSGQAQVRAVVRPRVVLVLCDGLTLDDFQRADGAVLAQLAEKNAFGLMNCAVAGPRSSTSATLTLAVGEHEAGLPADEQAANDWETIPDERGTIQTIYERRAGKSASLAAHHLKQIEIASLTQRGLNTTCVGAILAAQKPPFTTFVCGNADTDTPGRRAALLTLDRRGVGDGLVDGNTGVLLRKDTSLPFGLADNPFLLAETAQENEADFVVIQFGDLARLEASRLSPSSPAYRAARDGALRQISIFLLKLTMESPSRPTDVLLTAPYPAANGAAQSAHWPRLTPVLAFGPGFSPGLLTSATTRTPGLIANVDIAPTVLRLLHVPMPATMIGRPARSTPAFASGRYRYATVARMDYIADLNERTTYRAMPWVLLGGVLWTLGIVARFRLKGRAGVRGFTFGLLILLNFPAALLLAPLLVPPTMLEYVLRILAWMAGLAVACLLLARWTRSSPQVIAALLCLLLISGDTLAGQPLLKDSLLSAYYLSGIRFYGIGNEYLGVLLTFALLGGFAWLDERAALAPPIPLPIQGKETSTIRPFDRQRIVLVAAWLFLLFLLGWPGLGANAGSLAATGAGFGVGIAILWNRRPTLRLGAACLAAGLILMLAFSALDVAFASRDAASTSSHSGQAIQAAAGGRGASYLADIAVRKVGMNLRLLVSPWLLAGCGLLAATLFAAHCLLGAAFKEVLDRRSWTKRGLPALFAAGLSALVFKDSGVVTVGFLVGSACLFMLYYAVTESGEPAGQ